MEGKLQMSLVNECKWCKYLLTAAWKPWILGVRTGYLTSGDLLIPLNTAVWSAIWKTKKKKKRVYTQALSQRVLRQCSFWTWIPNAVVLCWQKSHRISANMLLRITITPYYLCYPLWRHKASGFDDRQPGLREHVYQLDFDLCRHYFLQKHNDAKVLGFYEHIQRVCTFVSLCNCDE